MNVHGLHTVLASGAIYQTTETAVGFLAGRWDKLQIAEVFEQFISENKGNKKDK
jgi:hypothetical protein